MLNGKHRDSEALALPVKGVDFVILLIVEALEWKVFVIAVDWNFGNLNCLFFCQVVKKVVMSQGGRVEQIDKDQVVPDESACDEGIWEVVNRHCVVIDAQHCIDVELILLYLLLCPCFRAEGPQPKMAIIDVNCRKEGARSILLDLLKLNETVVFATDFLLERFGISLQRVLVDPVLSVTLACDSDG